MPSQYLFPIGILSSAALIASPFSFATASSPKDVQSLAQTLTVKIDSQNPGSGVLIARRGNIYTVLTAAHVVATEDEYDVVLSDLSRYPLDYQRVTKFETVDLALVEFESAKSYPIAEIADSSSLNVGLPLFVSGFPISFSGEAKWTFSAGTLMANARKALHDGYALVYSNDTLPGMSGGPVLNALGQVIGIHGRADTEQNTSEASEIRIKTGFNLGIPTRTFIQKLESLKLDLAINLPTASKTPEVRPWDDLVLAASQSFIAENYDSAIASLSDAIALKPDFAPAYEQRGFVKLAQSKFQAAIADFEQALMLSPNALLAYHGQAKALSQLGNRSGAIAAYTKIIQLAPNNAQAYNSRGAVKADLGDYTAAMKDYDRAIQLNSKLAAAYNNRAVALSKLGKIDRAIEDWNQSIRLRPNRALFFFNRGVARFQLDNSEGAIADFDQAITLDSSLIAAYHSRGLARLMSGNYQQAGQDFDHVLTVEPSFTESYFYRGIVRYRMKEFEHAIADFDQDLSANPNHSFGLTMRGLSHHQLGHSSKAVQDYTKAIALNSNASQASLNLGLLNYEAGEVRQALNQFQNSFQTNPKLYMAQLAMATALYRLGQPNLGMTQAQTALIQAPQFRDATTLRQSLWGDQLLTDLERMMSAPEWTSP